MRTVTVDLPWSKPPLTGNRTRGNPHARAKEVEDAKNEARAAILAAAPTMLPGVEITLHYRPSGRQRRDADNLFPTLKVVQDALVLEGVIYEDSWVTVPSATCRIHPPNGEPAAMWVELEEVE
jgi:Holliday junction resolvase RusA-like endonuclease